MMHIYNKSQPYNARCIKSLHFNTFVVNPNKIPTPKYTQILTK